MMEHYDGPDDGAVNEVLRRVADFKIEAESEDLTAFMTGIVDEAMAELRSRVADAARQSGCRAALVSEAMRVLASG